MAFSLLSLNSFGTSENTSVPPKTSAVPSQWRVVKGLAKYQMEKRRERNFLKVTTRVTVKLAHSVVRTKTAEMQRYWVMMLPTR